jgi:hypothetical protein
MNSPKFSQNSIPLRMALRLFLTNLAGFFSPGSLAGFWVRIRFFQNPARKKNPAGQEYEIPAEKNSCRDFLVSRQEFPARLQGKTVLPDC